MTKRDPILTEKQAVLVQYIASGTSISAAARKMGIGDKTARRWLELPHVKAALDEATGQIIQDIKTKVSQRFEEMTDNALNAIDTCVTGGILIPPAVQLKASQIVLDRVAPVEQANADEQSGHSGDDELLQYMTDDELAQMEEILARAEARKLEAERNIIPLRRA